VPAPPALTTTFALTLPADDSASDWIGTMTDFPDHMSHTKEPPKS
jgi:hypothetical protein